MRKGDIWRRRRQRGVKYDWGEEENMGTHMGGLWINKRKKFMARDDKNDPERRGRGGGMVGKSGEGKVRSK